MNRLSSSHSYVPSSTRSWNATFQDPAIAGKNLALLDEYIAQTESVTNAVLQSVGAYQSSLQELDDQIDMLDRHLDGLKKSHDNVEVTIQAIEKVLVKFDIPRQVEFILSKGKDADFEEFLDSFDRVLEAKVEVDAFQEKNPNLRPAKDASKKLHSLAVGAEQTLLSMFQEVLYGGTITIDPKAHSLNTLKDPTCHLAIIDPDCLDTLLKIAYRLRSVNNYDYIRHFTEHQVDTTMSYMQSIFDKSYHDAMQEHAVENKAHYYKGSHRFLTALLFFIRLASTELELCHELSTLRGTPLEGKFSGDERKLFLSVISPALAEILKQGPAIMDPPYKVSSNYVFLYLDIMDTLSVHSQAIEAMDLTLQFKPLDNSIRALTLKRMQDYLSGIDGNEAKPSPDGLVHQFTTNTIHFLISLFDYQQVLEDLLTSRDRGTSMTAAMKPLQRFMVDSIDSLSTNMEKKAKDYPKGSTAAFVFLLNNYHYMHTSITTSPHLAITVPTSQVDTIAKKVKECQQKYCESSWSKVVQTVSGETVAAINAKLVKYASRKDLSNGTKMLIKSLFHSFFEEFDRRYHQQLHLNVPDDELRSRIHREVIAYVIPAYQRVHDRYAGLGFTSHPGKYIKYDIPTLQAMLNALLEGKLKKKH